MELDPQFCSFSIHRHQSTIIQEPVIPDCPEEEYEYIRSYKPNCRTLGQRPSYNMGGGKPSKANRLADPNGDLFQDGQYANIYESESDNHAESVNRTTSHTMKSNMGFELEYEEYESEFYIDNGLQKHYPSVAYASPYESNSIKASAPYYEDIKTMEEQEGVTCNVDAQGTVQEDTEHTGNMIQETNVADDKSLVEHTKPKREPTYIEIVP